MLSRGCVLLSLLIAIACSPTQTTITRLTGNNYPSRPKDCDIRILTEAPTDRKYEELAILGTVKTQSGLPLGLSHLGDASGTGTDLNAMLPNIKVIACGLGADAILIKNVEPGSSEPGSLGKAYTIAIKFLN